MIHAAMLAGFSAILGGAIALVARRRPGILERIRTFAFAAAAGVGAGTPFGLSRCLTRAMRSCG